ncbi:MULTISPECIES: DUF6174 domain-containing protein [unclassified Nocardioides]|jgi:hypothetical protein|uniref:DUF6174 domain-containing protein n=1 Tax=unclassified Nocardioides TaxID=2615069 RepID=UPI000702CCE4|nr:MULTISPECIES: DUF6174 domain-containing protein [unclassified Nocardioides]KRC54825.1 hypothetical protein ASE19_05005 [Nocardioides sp. Root79]KRC73831.1 hypothetical protein ASE20_04215 [Nocardioides sp. Root240]
MSIPRPVVRTLLAPALTAVLALGLSACSHEDDATASDPTGTDPSPTVTDDGAPTWPTFAPADYTYRLEVMCFCPMTGPVEVTVADGEVVSATGLRNPGKGRPAPEFLRLTINDVIAKANDPSVAKADVTWPDGQDHPSRVAIDQIENAVDDEVTYVIRDVRVSAG